MPLISITGKLYFFCFTLVLSTLALVVFFGLASFLVKFDFGSTDEDEAEDDSLIEFEESSDELDVF